MIKALRGTAILAFPLLIVCLIGQAIASPADMRVLVNFVIALVLVLAIQSFSGNSGIISFGHLAFMGVGAYVAAIVTVDPLLKSGLTAIPKFILRHTWPFLPAVIVGGLVAAIVAAALGLVLTRMREGAMAMATIGVLIIFFVVADDWSQVTGGNSGIAGIPQSTGLFSALAFAVATIFVCRLFRDSSIGLQLRATRTDPVAAEALGAKVVRLRWIAWTVSGAIIGTGGALWAQYNIAVDPHQFYFDDTFRLLAMLVVGGLTSVSGGVVGVTVVTVVFELMRQLENQISLPGLTQIVVSLLILLVLNRRPEGIMGGQEIDEAIARLRRRRG